MAIETEDLKDFIIRARNAFERPQIKNSCISLNEFPYGCCMDASILLGKLMIEYGYEDFNLIGTNWDVLPTHAWLQNKEFIIDITADQFESWPNQELILPRHPLPSHYARYTITSENLVSTRHFTFGSIKAYNLMKEIINGQ